MYLGWKKYVPSYTLIYRHILLYTVIYRHIPSYTSKKVYTSIYRYVLSWKSYTSTYWYILFVKFTKKYIPVYTGIYFWGDSYTMIYHSIVYTCIYLYILVYTMVRNSRWGESMLSRPAAWLSDADSPISPRGRRALGDFRLSSLEAAAWRLMNRKKFRQHNHSSGNNLGSPFNSYPFRCDLIAPPIQFSLNFYMLAQFFTIQLSFTLCCQ